MSLLYSKISSIGISYPVPVRTLLVIFSRNAFFSYTFSLEAIAGV